MKDNFTRSETFRITFTGIFAGCPPPPKKKTEKETKLSLEEHIKKNVYDCIQRNIMYMCAYRPRTIFGLSNQ